MRGAPLPDPEASALWVFTDHKSLSNYTAQCLDNYITSDKVGGPRGSGSEQSARARPFALI